LPDGGAFIIRQILAAFARIRDNIAQVSVVIIAATDAYGHRATVFHARHDAAHWLRVYTPHGRLQDQDSTIQPDSTAHYRRPIKE
jgi:hypothetical protein